MKNILIPFAILAVVMSGCSTAYKASVTPDDVYYSPAPPAKEGVKDAQDDYSSNSDDNYLRMKVRNRYQWNGIDDYNYWNDSRYDFGYSCTPSRTVLLNPYNPFTYGNCFGFGYYSPWNSYYSPYSTIVYYKNPRVYYGNTGKTNLTAYRNRNYNNGNNTFGGLLKNVFNSNNSSSNNSTNPSRSFGSGTTPSNNAGGRSGGYNSSGSSSGSSRPPRGGK